MAADFEVTGATAPHIGGTTPRVDEARRSVTRTTVTPAPGNEKNEVSESSEGRAKRSLMDWLRSSQHGELTSARRPYAGSNALRLIMATTLSVLCLLTIGGAILVLLLWQQDRASGVLSSQLDRTWDLFDLLRQAERWIAFAVIPMAAAWMALAAINIHRATGKRRNPIVAAVSLPIGLFGAWLIGAQIVAEADDWVGQAAGYVLQAIFLAIPLLALERLAAAADSRHRPIQVTYLLAAVYLAQMQFLGGLSTVDRGSAADHWGRIGAYLVIGGLIQVLGTLAANEAARAIEEGTENRFQLRARFGESLLSQVESH